MGGWWDQEYGASPLSLDDLLVALTFCSVFSSLSPLLSSCVLCYLPVSKDAMKLSAEFMRLFVIGEEIWASPIAGLLSNISNGFSSFQRPFTALQRLPRRTGVRQSKLNIFRRFFRSCCLISSLGVCVCPCIWKSYWTAKSKRKTQSNERHKVTKGTKKEREEERNKENKGKSKKKKKKKKMQ